MGGKTANLNIMRKLRLQLKSGYIKKEPASYLYMKRYPPLMRDTAPISNKIDIKTIPYLKLYKQAVEKNPVYTDERVLLLLLLYYYSLYYYNHHHNHNNNHHIIIIIIRYIQHIGKMNHKH